MAFPIVIVDTPLFSLRYNAKGDVELTKAESTRVLWPDPGPRSQTAVQIITREALVPSVGKLARNSMDG